MKFSSMAAAPDTTPTIYCTRTNSLIDTCLPGQDGPEVKLARHRKHYGPDLILLPFDEAWRRHEAAAKTEPTEIAEQDWHYALNVLPPVSWNQTCAGESFKMSERLTGAITGIYVQLQGRFFTFYDDIRTPHAECCRRVRESRAFSSTAPNVAHVADAGDQPRQGNGPGWPSDERGDGR